jgi:archaeal type IV pilus assembly protein PilA
MNKYFNKFKKNAKALSPVVASIILIAVTVAVSVVVAAWMGGMTIGLMGSAEQISITNVALDANNIQVLVQNAGGTQGTINSAFINGVATTVFTPVQVAKSNQTTLIFTNNVGSANATFTMTPGTSYTIKLITAKGTSVVSSATTYSP